jgi:NTP pyrophosphatase (non-canonical NTP hydrolase)
MEIYDVIWNLLDLAELAGVDLEEAFRKKAGLNEGREWR